METSSPEKIKMQIPIAKPTMTGDEGDLMQQVLESGWVSMGPLTQQFETQIARVTGAQHAVAMNSCTSAIHIAMLIHGIGAGHDVICPSYSFIASANGVRHSGAEPVFADIDPETLNLDPQSVEKMILENYDSDLRHRKNGRQLRAIHLVHQLGIPADIDTFAALAEKYNLVLIEDNACGLGSTYKLQPLGSSGFTSSMSFHPRKVITTGEGGMLLTGNADLASKAEVYRAHGMSISDLARHNSKATTFESYDVAGYNYRLTDIQSAIGLKQLEHLEAFIKRRREIAAAYNQAFSAVEGVSIIQPPGYVTRWNYQSYPVRLINSSQDVRDNFMLALQERGVTTRRGIPPIHLEPVYEQGLVLPHTEAVSQTSMMLPIFPLMTDAEVTYVVENVLDVSRILL